MVEEATRKTTVVVCTWPISASTVHNARSRRRSASLARSKRCGSLAIRHVSRSSSFDVDKMPRRPSAKWTTVWCAARECDARGHGPEPVAARRPLRAPTVRSDAISAARRDISREIVEVAVVVEVAIEVEAVVVAAAEVDATTMTTDALKILEGKNLSHGFYVEFVFFYMLHFILFCFVMLYSSFLF